MILMDGKKIREEILEKVKVEIDKLDRKLGLVVIQVGSDIASDVYVRQKEKICDRLGINFRCVKLDEEVSEDYLFNLIDGLNLDEMVDGIMIQLPIPKHLGLRRVIDRIDPDKDVDGLTSFNKSKLESGKDCLIPCTAIGIVEMLKYYDIKIMDKNVVVVGRSDLVGKPVSKLLEYEGGNVTVCHSRTLDIAKYTKKADILVVAVGRCSLIKKDMVKDGVVVIDVGINRVDDNIYGDVEFLEVSKKSSYITPVPGGVGPMTLASLIKNLLKAYNLKKV